MPRRTARGTRNVWRECARPVLPQPRPFQRRADAPRRRDELQSNNGRRRHRNTNNAAARGEDGGRSNTAPAPVLGASSAAAPPPIVRVRRSETSHTTPVRGLCDEPPTSERQNIRERGTENVRLQPRVARVDAQSTNFKQRQAFWAAVIVRFAMRIRRSRNRQGESAMMRHVRNRHGALRDYSVIAGCETRCASGSPLSTLSLASLSQDGSR